MVEVCSTSLAEPAPTRQPPAAGGAWAGSVLTRLPAGAAPWSAPLVLCMCSSYLVGVRVRVKG